MSTDCYELAYERATNEIAEINAQLQRIKIQIQKLTVRRELLGKLLEPLGLVAAGVTSNAFQAELSDGSDGASPQLSQVMVLVGLPELQPASLEVPVSRMDSQPEETNGHVAGDSQAIRYEDVAELAYRFWNERGQAHGHHEEDWARAIAEVEGLAA